jgi:Leucine-rich repeat (LRR) protein
MRKILFSLMLCMLFVLPVLAQEEAQTPYEIALQRIEEARVSEATDLDLSRLELAELPSEIGSLSNLQVLNLSFNQLSNLPPEIGDLTNLEFLYIWNNQLRSLPSEIGKLENLWGLYLSNNQLNQLPHEIIGLNTLCYLDLSDNQFQRLPVELGILPNLTEDEVCYSPELSTFLDVAGNPLVSPPPEVVAEGTPAILEYLRNESWRNLQRLIFSGAGSIGLLVVGVLALRWQQRQNWEKKKNKAKGSNPLD